MEPFEISAIVIEYLQGGSLFAFWEWSAETAGAIQRGAAFLKI